MAAHPTVCDIKPPIQMCNNYQETLATNVAIQPPRATNASNTTWPPQNDRKYNLT